MRFRPSLAFAVATAVIVLPAAPARAHEEISPKTLTVGEPAYLSLTVANEKEVKLVKVRLDAPSGIEFGTALEGKDGWATTRSSGRMTWDGEVDSEHFETFRFEVEAPDQPGTLSYKVTLSFAGGLTEEHEVDVTAVAGSPATTGLTSTPNLTAETAPTTPAPTTPTTTAAAPDDSGGDSGPAKAALAVSIVALLVAAGALAATRRPGGGPGANRASDSGPAAGAAQDW
jgi:uncharacterized protein YcnI